MRSGRCAGSVLALAALMAGTLSGCAGSRPTLAVGVPFTDLRAKPHTVAAAHIHDPLEETQLLFGELVRLLKMDGDWAYVESLEQPEFSHEERWQGYPGWVRVDALVPEHTQATIVVTAKWASTWKNFYKLEPSPWRFSLGTRLPAKDMAGQLWRIELPGGGRVWMTYSDARPLAQLAGLSEEERRELVLRNAREFLGDDYYWGGRTPADDSARQPTGVDCSGLVNLAYRAAGVDIPRDAHEQFLRAKSVDTPAPADLVFLSDRSDRSRIVHVLLYAGDDQLIEGPGTGESIRQISATDRLGAPLHTLKAGAQSNGQTVFFGTFLP